MSKRLTVVSILCLVAVFLISGSALAGEVDKARISDMTDAAGGLADLISPPAGASHTIPLNPGQVLTSPGYMVGTTHYDMQTNASTGNRIVKDASGNIHVCWMNGVNQVSGNRWIYYNFRDAASGFWNWTTTGTQVNPPPQGDGYTNLDVRSGGEAVITYHSIVDADWTVVSADLLPGFGQFTEYDVPDILSNPEMECIWSYVAVDRQDRIQIVAHEYISAGGEPKRLMYTRSDDGGRTWPDPVIVDTLHSIAGIIVASSVDDKVAIVYGHHTVNPDVRHDLYYVESEDGITWDWNNKVNVTNFYTNPSLDSTVAYQDNDAVYDKDGNLHIVWIGTHWASGGGWYYHSYLMHWSEATGITEIAEHPQHDFTSCSPGDHNLAFAKLSIACDSDNNLFVIATRFDNQDCSVGGYANGEIYGTGSRDGGATWGDVVNLTNSPTPDCWPGECDSDHWSSLAEMVDDSLYILYINDKDAGGAPRPEGVATENPVMYYAFDKDALLPAGVSMSCKTFPAFCRGSEFLFRLIVRNESPGNVSGTLTFSAYSDHYCDPANLLVSIPRNKTFAPGTTVSYYGFEIPNQISTGPYSASVGGALGGSDVYCCMNTNIIRCSPWRSEDHTAWELVEVDRADFELPTFTSLSQNYPNPFNANTSISYTLAEAGNVNLSVYDISGRLVATLVDGHQVSGEHTATWSASEFSSGVYFYKLTTADYTATKKMHLLK